MAMLLTCKDLAKTFGSRTLFEGVSFAVSEGECVGLIGPNGSGKSTLMRLLAGLETPDLVGSTASIITRRNLRVGYVAQRDEFDDDATLLDVVMGKLSDSFHDEHERQDRASAALVRVGLTDPAQRAGKLSGGWRKRLAIARELAREPDLLLMDEPTNHLDLAGIDWLEELLGDVSFATVVVTHDRYFLEAVSTRVVELSRAYAGGVFSVEGSYSTFLQRRAEYLEAQAQAQQGLAVKVREDLRWLSRGAKARRTKSKSRIDASHQRMEELAELQARNAPARAAGIDFNATGRQTRMLLTTKGLTKSLGDRLLFRDVEFTLSPGTRLGLLGPNGSGKTTLIRLLSDELEPDAGQIRRAEKLRTVVFTQRREALNLTEPLREALCPGSDYVFVGSQQVHVNTWANRFLFRTDQLKTSVGDLSGGEQARILIAQLMLKPADLLILDEPTNDLDIASLEVLEQSLLDFPGAVVLVTHDRYMLDRLATEVLGLDGKGGAKLYASLSQWRADMESREADVTEQARDAKPAAAPKEPAKPAAANRPRLTWKEQRELEQMETNITEAESRVQQIEAMIADPAVSTDHRRLQECCHDLDIAHAEVTRLYARWEELEAKR